MTKTNHVPIASAYAVIPTKEEEVETAVPIQTAHAVEPLDRSTVEESSSSPNVHGSNMISEAEGLPWRDDFFDNEKDIIAVFDLDYDSMERHYKALSWSCMAGAVICIPNVVPCLLVGLVPCFLNKNVEWSVRSQHLAVTRNGVLYVQDQRPTMWGGPCQERKRSRIIPFDQITDCTVTEKGGSKCGDGAPISVVSLNMQTSGSNKNIANKNASKNEIKIPGLHDPHGFQRLILAMKRQQGSNFHHHQHFPATTAAMPVTMDQIERQLENHGDQGEDVAGLLRDIRDELRQHNELLQSMQAHKEQA